MSKEPKHCEKCHQNAVYFSSYCGADVCDLCGHHQKLARCFCGWAADDGNGYQQLIDMGETIEPEDY